MLRPKRKVVVEGKEITFNNHKIEPVIKNENSFNPHSNIIRNRIPFWVKITPESLSEAEVFSRKMAFGDGYSRAVRWGGSVDRSRHEKYADNLQGKLSEFAFFELCQSQGVHVEKPDCTVMKRGKWDDGDFIISGKNISIKSSMLRSKLLLMECAAYRDDGYELNFRPPKRIDMILMYRIALSEGEFGHKTSVLYYFDEKNKTGNEDISNMWAWADLCGYITNADFCYLTANGFKKRIGETILPESPIVMDADNYWISVGDMRNPRFLFEDLKQLSSE